MNRLTVALCTYNRAKFLKDAINGIQNQTYKDFDFVIYDNASTDNTEEVIKSFNDDRIKYLKFDTNVGMAGNWLRAVKGCKTEYLSIAHDDDIWEPALLEKELKIFESNCDILLVSCKSQYVNEDNEILEGKCNSTFTEDKIYDKYGLFNMMYEYTGANFISAPAVMIRTSCLDQIDYGFFGETGSTADIYWYLRINEIGKVYLMKEPLLRYRIHGGQYSDDRLSQIIEHRDYILPVLNEYLSDQQVSKIREVYQKEIDALEFIKTITADINSEMKGFYIPGKLYVDEDLMARIKLLSHISKGEPKKYVIWGASIAGFKNKQIFDVVLPNYDLVGFIDKNKKGMFEGLPIFSPEKYNFNGQDVIIICTSTGAYDIKNFLEEKGLVFKKDFMVGNVVR